MHARQPFSIAGEWPGNLTHLNDEVEFYDEGQVSVRISFPQTADVARIITLKIDIRYEIRTHDTSFVKFRSNYISTNEQY